MQIRLAEDVLSLEAREMRVRGEEDVVKAADQRIVLVRAVVPVDAAQLLGESALRHVVEHVERGLRRPAEEHRAGDMAL